MSDGLFTLVSGKIIIFFLLRITKMGNNQNKFRMFFGLKETPPPEEIENEIRREEWSEGLIWHGILITPYIITRTRGISCPKNLIKCMRLCPKNH